MTVKKTLNIKGNITHYITLNIRGQLKNCNFTGTALN